MEREGVSSEFPAEAEPGGGSLGSEPALWDPMPLLGQSIMLVWGPQWEAQVGGK